MLGTYNIQNPILIQTLLAMTQDRIHNTNTATRFLPALTKLSEGRSESEEETKLITELKAVLKYTIAYLTIQHSGIDASNYQDDILPLLLTADLTKLNCYQLFIAQPSIAENPSAHAGKSKSNPKPIMTVISLPLFSPAAALIILTQANQQQASQLLADNTDEENSTISQLGMLAVEGAEKSTDNSIKFQFILRLFYTFPEHESLVEFLMSNASILATTRAAHEFLWKQEQDIPHDLVTNYTALVSYGNGIVLTYLLRADCYPPPWVNPKTFPESARVALLAHLQNISNSPEKLQKLFERNSHLSKLLSSEQWVTLITSESLQSIFSHLLTIHAPEVFACNQQESEQRNEKLFASLLNHSPEVFLTFYLDRQPKFIPVDTIIQTLTQLQTPGYKQLARIANHFDKSGTLHIAQLFFKAVPDEQLGDYQKKRKGELCEVPQSAQAVLSYFNKTIAADQIARFEHLQQLVEATSPEDFEKMKGEAPTGNISHQYFDAIQSVQFDELQIAKIHEGFKRSLGSISERVATEKKKLQPASSGSAWNTLTSYMPVFGGRPNS